MAHVWCDGVMCDAGSDGPCQGRSRPELWPAVSVGGLVWCVGDGVEWFSELWVAVGGHVVEGNVVGHSGSHSSCESSNLLMDVFQECVGGPAAMLFDDGGINPIELHGHGPTSPQGVAADIGAVESKLMEAQSGDGIFDGSVDVTGGDLAGVPRSFKVSADGSVDVGGVGQDVGNAASQGFDWAGG